MKITRSQLRSIISEEITRLVREADENVSNVDKGILLAGDSQMAGLLGDELSNMLGVRRTYAQRGASGNTIASNIAQHTGDATVGAVVNFGDNDFRDPGVKAIVSVLKTTPAYQEDPRSIVVIGPPPAFKPSERWINKKTRKYMSLSEDNPFFWEKIWVEKQRTNEVIKAAVEGAGMTFINPYDHIPSVFPNKEDEVVSRDGTHYEGSYAKNLVDAISSQLPTGVA